MSQNHVVVSELLNSHYEYRKLADKHKQIQHEISELELHPATGEQELRRLKRLKLKIRDRMAWLQNKAIH